MGAKEATFRLRAMCLLSVLSCMLFTSLIAIVCNEKGELNVALVDTQQELANAKKELNDTIRRFEKIIEMQALEIAAMKKALDTVLKMQAVEVETTRKTLNKMQENVASKGWEKMKTQSKSDSDDQVSDYKLLVVFLSTYTRVILTYGLMVPGDLGNMSNAFHCL